VETPLEDLIRLILEYREMAKLVSTYGESFTKKINRNTGKVHTEYSQARTKTGRLSSSKPNLQNIPKDANIRKAFIAEENYIFMTIDYGSQEMKIITSLSKDEILLKAINEGLDLHTYLATNSFRIINNNPNYEISKQERTLHKPVLFGWLYGAGPFRIHKVLNVSINIAKLIKQKLDNALFGASTFLNKVRDAAVKNRIVFDLAKTNRRRFFTKEIAEHSLRKQGGNFPIQSTGASMVKEAMVRTEFEILREIRKDYPLTQAVLQVHDECVYQLPIELAEKIAKRIQKLWIEIGETYLDSVKIEADYKLEKYWIK